MFVVFADIWQNYAYTYCTKKISQRNVIKENNHSRKFLNCFLVGFTKFPNGIQSSIWKVISSTWEPGFFIYLRKLNIFVERMYQLKNFDINLKGYHLRCLLL